MSTRRREKPKRTNRAERASQGESRRRPRPAADPFHLPTGRFSYGSRSNHVSRFSLREVLPYFGIEESPYSRRLIEFWDGDVSASYLLAVRSVAGWVDFLPALSIRVIPDPAAPIDQKGAEAITLQHHAYFEATMTLGDSIAAGLAGYPRAAFALIRPFLELATAEVYVNEQIGEERLLKFLDFLRGAGHRPRYAEMLSAVFAEDRFKSVRSFRSQVEAVYSAASTGLHVRSIDDSGLDMRDGNRAQGTFLETNFWLATLGIAVQRMLALLTLRYPMVLFPVDVERTFAYSGPVGVVVDKATSDSVAEGLSDRHAVALRSFLEKDPHVTATLEWFRSQPTLTDEQIASNWEELVRDHPERPFLRDVPQAGRTAHQRAEMGSLTWALDGAAAIRHVVEPPDLDLDRMLQVEVLATELKSWYPPLASGVDEH